MEALSNRPEQRKHADTGVQTAWDSAAAPWVSRFMEDEDRRYVSSALMSRAAALIDAIAREASSRGFVVPPPDDGLLELVRERRWPWPHAVVDMGGNRLVSFHMAEASLPVTGAQEPTAAAASDPQEAGSAVIDGETPFGETPLWIAQRQRAFIPSGTLTLAIDSDMRHGHQRSSRDSAKSLIESRLPALFDSLVACVVRQRDREATARLRRDSLDRAQRECHGEQLYQALCEEVRLHEDLNAQRAYLDKVEQRMLHADPDELKRNGDSIRLMRERIDARDPLLAGGMEWMHLPRPSESEVFAYMRRDSRLSAFEEDQLTRRRPGARSTFPSYDAGYGDGFFD